MSVDTRRAELELQWALEDYPWLRDVLRKCVVEHHDDGMMGFRVRIGPRPDGWAGMDRLERVFRAFGPTRLEVERRIGPRGDVPATRRPSLMKALDAAGLPDED